MTVPEKLEKIFRDVCERGETVAVPAKLKRIFDNVWSRDEEREKRGEKRFESLSSKDQLAIICLCTRRICLRKKEFSNAMKMIREELSHYSSADAKVYGIRIYEDKRDKLILSYKYREESNNEEDIDQRVRISQRWMGFDEKEFKYIVNTIKREREKIESSQIIRNETLNGLMSDPELEPRISILVKKMYSKLIDDRFEILIKRLKDVAKRGRGLKEKEVKAIVNEFSEKGWGRIISEELKEEGERGIRRRIEDAYSKRREGEKMFQMNEIPLLF